MCGAHSPLGTSRKGSADRSMGKSLDREKVALLLGGKAGLGWYG